jgi:hypothetical protein
MKKTWKNVSSSLGPKKPEPTDVGMETALARPIRNWCNVGGKLITCPCINVPVIKLKNKRSSNFVTTLSFHPSPPNQWGRNRIPPPQMETTSLSLRKTLLDRSISLLSPPKPSEATKSSLQWRRCGCSCAASPPPTLTMQRHNPHPVFKPKLNAHSMCAQELSLRTYHTQNGYRITNVSV